jgi:hypothetical protein
MYGIAWFDKNGKAYKIIQYERKDINKQFNRDTFDALPPGHSMRRVKLNDKREIIKDYSSR